MVPANSVPNNYLFELHGDQLVSLLLESFDDLSNESAMNAVGFDHDEGSLGVGHFGNAELRTEILRFIDFRLVLNKVFKSTQDNQGTLAQLVTSAINSRL
jgi:hypothetical protein